MTYAEAEKQYPDMIIIVQNAFLFCGYGRSAAIMHEVMGYSLFVDGRGRLTTGGPINKMVSEFDRLNLGYVILRNGQADVHPGNVFNLPRSLLDYEFQGQNYKPKRKKDAHKALKNSGVCIGSFVELDMGNGPKFFTVMHEDDIGDSQGFIAMEKPIGQAIYGHKTGDSVVVHMPNNDITVTIMSIDNSAFSNESMENKDKDAIYRSDEDLQEELKAAFKDYFPYNLLAEIFGIKEVNLGYYYRTFPQDIDNRLETVLQSLEPRSREMIEYYYRDRETLETIGNRYGLSRERVRQIILKALRKMRYPKTACKFEYNPTYESDIIRDYEQQLADVATAYADVEDCLIDLNKRLLAMEVFVQQALISNGMSELNSEEFLRVLNEIIGRSVDGPEPFKPKVLEDNNAKEKSMKDAIEELVLSPRAYNSLKRAHIDDIGTLVCSIESGSLHKFRNLGRKTLDEILSVLRDSYDIDYTKTYWANVAKIENDAWMKSYMASLHGIPDNVIKLGSTVTIRHDNEVICYKIVMPENEDLSQNKVSLLSPIGKALLGRKRGEIAVMNSHMGTVTMEIVAVDN